MNNEKCGQFEASCGCGQGGCDAGDELSGIILTVSS